MNQLISIVTPVYNIEKFIKDTIQLNEWQPKHEIFMFQNIIAIHK